MQDPPTMTELLESVRNFLETEVVPGLLDPRRRFRMLVAVNVLSVAAREAELEEGLLRSELRRLENLLGPGDGRPKEKESRRALQRDVASRNEALARGIREGTIHSAPGTPVWDHLRQTVLEKLRVANPRHLERLGEHPEGELPR